MGGLGRRLQIHWHFLVSQVLFLKSYTDCDPVPDQIDNKNKKRMDKVPITLSNLVALALL
jgi:hypothetical protein